MENEGVAVAEKTDDDRFVEHLKNAVETVQTWPEWKRQMLGAIVVRVSVRRKQPMRSDDMPDE